MTGEVAVVGAGAAGTAAAYALEEAGLGTTVYEKSEDVGGRAGTRQRDGCTYETGANYLRSDDELVTGLVTETLPTEGLVRVDEPVSTFDGSGTVTEGRSAQGPRYTYENGLAELSRRLIEAAGAQLRCDRAVAALNRTPDGWILRLRSDEETGPFDSVVVTAPAPLSADVLGASEYSHGDRRELREGIAGVPFRTIVSVVLHYPFELDRPYYALVNPDGAHDAGWIAREDRKPGHVPEGESVVLVQCAPRWSREHFGAADPVIVDSAAAMAADVLGEDRLLEPDWTDQRRWRYAAPDGAPEADLLAAAAERGLYFAGDWVAGEDRLHAAVRSGLEAGHDVADARR